MPNVLRVIIVGTIALVIGGVNSFSQTASDSNRAATVQGKVTKAASGEPIKNALVELQARDANGTSYRTLSDAEGHFLLKDVLPGRYVLTAERPGFMLQSYTVDSVPTEVNLRAGQDLTDAWFRLNEPAVMSGHVSDENGDPMIHATAQALSRRRVQGVSKLVPVKSSETDDRGDFRIGGLHPGTYLVKVTPQDPVAFDGAGKYVDQAIFAGYVPTYYPNSYDPQQATPIQLTWGQEVPLSLSLWPVKTYTVSGRLLVQGSADVPSVVLRSAHGFGGGITYQADLQAGRRFQFRHVVPGEYVLSAMSRGAGEMLSGRQTVLVADTDISGLSLALEQPFTITGRVTVDTAIKEWSSMAVQLIPEDDDEASAYVSAVGRDGTFSMKNLQNGSYRIATTGLPGDFYLKSVTLGHDEVISGLTLSNESATQSLQLTLSSAGGHVQGVVTEDDKAVGGAHVLLIPEQPHPGWTEALGQAVADQQGKYSLYGLPPGGYKIVAWPSGSTQAPEDLQAARQNSSAKSVKVEPNGAYQINISTIQNEHSGQ